MESSLKRYIKDITKAKLYKYYLPLTKLYIDRQKIKKFTLSALRNYASLRIKLLQNDKLMEVEEELIIVMVKAVVTSTLKDQKYPQKEIDKAIDYILPEVLKELNTLRYNIFIELLEFANRASK